MAEVAFAEHEGFSLSSPGPGEWSLVVQRFQQEQGEAIVRSWVRPLGFSSFCTGVVTLSSPTPFLRDWVENNYLHRLTEIWSSLNPNVRSLILVMSDAQPQEVSSSEKVESAVESLPDQGGGLDPKLTFENFIVGKPNELAYAAARRVAEAVNIAFNPLFLYSSVGLGKTHLMHAIAWHIQKNQKRRVIYMSAEQFMYQFVRAVRYRDTMTFKDQFRSVDVLMIDDIQFICGKDSTQEEFFHTFNALVDNNRQVVVSADKSPCDLEGMEERMRSRLGWGLVADIHPTTYELRLGILQAKTQHISVKLPAKVLEFLAHTITSNVRELEGALNRIVANAQLVGREITLESAQDVLKDLLRANDRRVTIEEIQRKVADHYAIRLADIHSTRRSNHVARPRQIAMYLAKILTSASFPEIGRKFGGRDHTTVIHAVRRIDDLIGRDPVLSEDVRLLRRMLA
ncbi:MAG: chromosomal replication initiator protein DnaA [Holosporales bacterium]|jgi:chromosomal replication initiator protein|nr:chromosomal replication initiator protein DnaA [Holosporales bacterium]